MLGSGATLTVSRGDRPLLGGDRTSGSDALHVDLLWSRGIFGSRIGAAGLHVVDLDGDGNNEIVATTTDGFWYVVKHDGQGYRQSWVSPITYSMIPPRISALQIADVDGDGHPDVLIGYDNKVEIRDGPTLDVMSTLLTGASSVLTPNVADVDGDGVLELVFCDSANVYVYDLANGQPKWIGTGYGGWVVVVANVDADPDLEIVVANTPGYVLNGRTHVVKWQNPAGFGRCVRAGDLDGDGMAEVVAGAVSHHFTVYDIDLQAPKYDIPLQYDGGTVELADVDQDGALEIVYADGPGYIYVHAGVDGAFKWSIYSPESGVAGVAVGDTDGDGVNELIWGAGGGSPNYLFVADCGTHQIEWTSEDIRGPFYGLDYGDVDTDGTSELLYTCFSSDNGYGNGLWFVHDATTFALKYQGGTPTMNWTGLYRIRHANLDDDPQAEILVPTSDLYTGKLICYDGLTHLEQWRGTLPDGFEFRALQIGDVDGDGQLEAVCGAGRQGSGPPQDYLYVFDTQSGSVKWHALSLGPYRYFSLLRLGQVDTDPNLEIVVGNYSYGGGLRVYDGVTRIQEAVSENLDLTALELADLDGDGIQEIIAGSEYGALQVIDPATGGVARVIANYGVPINGLAVRDVNGDGVPDYIFGFGDRLCIFDGTAPWSLIWNSERIAPEVGKNDGVLLADINADGRLELVANTDKGVRVYGLWMDCNNNGVPDDVDIANGTSTDCDHDGVPDECEAFLDCNGNGVFDACDIFNATSTDCNNNGIPDECESQADCNGNGALDICDIASGISQDCNSNAVPDECESQADCNANGVLDICDIASGTSTDCNANGVPDECEPSADCNGNGAFDACDIAAGVSTDCNANGVPDECEPFVDCNGNGIFDACDIALGNSFDCNSNGVPDECDIIFGGLPDCNSNGTPDECDLVSGFSYDCNGNGVPDDCDVVNGTSQDANSNGVPDECELACIGDLNCDGFIGFADINAFVLYLSNYALWQTTFAGCDPRGGDMNCDGTYGQWSFGDINPFVEVMIQCGMGCPCPGPVSCP